MHPRVVELAERVGIQDHAVAGIQGHAVAETPTGVARALLYIVRASSFLLHPLYKSFYHTFHQNGQRCVGGICSVDDMEVPS